MFCCMFKHAGAQVSKKHQKFLNLVIPTKPLSLSVVSILAWLSWDRLLLPRPCGPNLREEHPLCSKTSPNSNLPCPWPPKSMSPVFYCNWTVTQTRGILYFREFISYRFSSLEKRTLNNQPVWWIYKRCLFTWRNKWHRLEPATTLSPRHYSAVPSWMRIILRSNGTEECHEMTWNVWHKMRCKSCWKRIWWDHKGTNDRRVS